MFCEPPGWKPGENLRQIHVLCIFSKDPLVNLQGPLFENPKYWWIRNASVCCEGEFHSKRNEHEGLIKHAVDIYAAFFFFHPTYTSTVMCTLENLSL